MKKLLIGSMVLFAVLFVFILGCEPDDSEEPYPPPNIDHNFGEMTDDRDNQTYKTIEIGNQTWMAENLNFTPDTGNSWCYGNDTNNCDTYGRLYDWDTAREVCPEGWHLPSDDEWTSLITELDPSASSTLIQSTIAGGMMKSTGTIEEGTGLWYDPNEGATNESGFSGLPGGFRNYSGSFSLLGSSGGWWSSDETDSSRASFQSMGHRFSYVYRYDNPKQLGFSVRCIKD